MGFLSKLKSAFGGVEIDEPIEKQKQEAMANPLVKQGLWKISEGCDQTPNAEGEFGRTPTNPIPVNGLYGEFAYLNRLRGRTGVCFMFHRIGSEKSSTTGHDVDLYELVSLDGEHWERLYFDMYYAHRSQKSPSGLYLMNWSDTPDHMKAAIKHGFFGTNKKVNEFPLGLPSVVANDPGINSLSAGLGKIFANKIRDAFDRVPKHKWNRPKAWKEEEIPQSATWLPPQGTAYENYAIIWQEITAASDIAQTFQLGRGGEIPYLVYGQTLKDMKANKEIPLSEFMLLSGILANWSFPNPKIDRRKNEGLWRLLLDKLGAGFRFTEPDKMILDVAHKMREELGAEVSCKVLMAGVELIPNNSKIKSDLVLDIFELHRLKRNILDLAMINKLCSQIDFNDIDPGAAQIVAYTNLCALYFVGEKNKIHNFLEEVIYDKVSHPNLKVKIKDMLDGKASIDDMFVQ